MLILMPIFAVIVPQFHIHMTHFSLIFVVNLGIGYLMPPVGVNLYMVMALMGENLIFVCKAVVPTLLILIVMLLIITYVSAISLFLPRLFGDARKKRIWYPILLFRVGPGEIYDIAEEVALEDRLFLP